MDYDDYFSDKAAAKAYAKEQTERAKAERQQNKEVDAKEEAYRKKHNIGPEVRGYQHMIAAEAEEKALRQKAIEDLTNKKGTNLNKEADRAIRGGAAGGGGGSMTDPMERKTKPYNKARGGIIKSSASKRADGCAIKGKTKGRMV
jgi:hypothetical protein